MNKDHLLLQASAQSPKVSNLPRIAGSVEHVVLLFSNSVNSVKVENGKVTCREISKNKEDGTMKRF